MFYSRSSSSNTKRRRPNPGRRLASAPSRTKKMWFDGTQGRSPHPDKRVSCSPGSACGAARGDSSRGCQRMGMRAARVEASHNGGYGLYNAVTMEGLGERSLGSQARRLWTHTLARKLMEKEPCSVSSRFPRGPERGPVPARHGWLWLSQFRMISRLFRFSSPLVTIFLFTTQSVLTASRSRIKQSPCKLSMI